MFLDSSALVAIMANEHDGPMLAARLEGAPDPVTSPIVIYEATLALRRKAMLAVEAVLTDVRDFLARAGVAVVPVNPDDHIIALQAFARYGKGTGSAAQLNLGDCFSYAVAKRRGVPLLYKGNDFAQTDLR